MNAPTILKQNPDFIVLNKPAGWLSIPAREPKATDLVLTEWLEKECGTTPWVVHRLDRFTSGVILFAQNKAAHQEANRWFEQKEVKKIYQFFAAPAPHCALNTRPALQMKTPVDGKPSQTLFEVIQKFEVSSPHGSTVSKIIYGKATPLTGRFHQVREHAREGAFPLLGDSAYGYDAAQTGIQFSRVALHAYELTLPFGKVQAPLPDDMTKLLHQLEKQLEKTGAHLK